METRSNFEDKLQEMFEDFSTPLRDSQWARMESALLERKKSRKAWWKLMTIFLLVGTLCFSAGYLLRDTNKSVTRLNTTEVKKSIPSENHSSAVSTLTTEHNNYKSIAKNEIDSKQKSNSQQHISITTKENKTFFAAKTEKLIANLKEKNNQTREKQEEPNVSIKPEQSKKENQTNFAAEGNYGISTSSWFAKGIAAYKIPVVKQLSLIPDYLNYDQPIEITPRPPDVSWLEILKKSMSVGFALGTYQENNQLENNSTERDSINDIAGIIEKQDKKSVGNNIGLQLQFQFYKGFSFNTGLIYNQSKMNTNFTFIQNNVPFYDSAGKVLGYIYIHDSFAPRVPVNINNSNSFLQIPLQLAYHKNIGKNFKAGLNGGVNLNIPLSLNYSYFDESILSYQPFSKNNIKLGNGYSLGANVEYRLYKPLWIGLNYQLQKSKTIYNFNKKEAVTKNLRQQINLTLTMQL